MASKTLQVKKQEPVKKVEQKTPAQVPPMVAKPGGTEPGIRPMVQAPVDVQEQRTTTTIQISMENKGRLEILKGMLDIGDFDGVVTRLIDALPQKLSTEQEIHLVMPVSKFRWLLAHQDSCDCRAALNDAKV